MKTSANARATKEGIGYQEVYEGGGREAGGA